MADLRIEEYNVGDIGTNCYFIVNADTKEMVIIDPGGDGADLIWWNISDHHCWCYH